jgi:hypothetical protein
MAGGCDAGRPNPRVAQQQKNSFERVDILFSENQIHAITFHRRIRRLAKVNDERG